MKNKLTLYLSLRPQFDTIERAMPLNQFAEVEAVLYLLHKMVHIDADPYKAYLLFSGYQSIGIEHTRTIDYTLQCARKSLGRYRSKKLWTDSLNEYFDKKYSAYRAFEQKKEVESTSLIFQSEEYPYPFEKRKEEWRALWELYEDNAPTVRYADAGRYSYTYPQGDNHEAEQISVSFSKAEIMTHLSRSSNAPSKEKVCISMAELLETAKMMKEKFPADYSYDVLNSNQLKRVCDSSKVTQTEYLEIDKVCNIVGMVGSGKSTLIKILSYWSWMNNKKIMIVLDTVADVMSLWEYFHRLGISCSPVIGRSQRLKYVNQVAQEEDFSLSPELAGYLTPTCMVDGKDETYSEAIPYGQEPCYAICKGKQRQLCPYFDFCSGTAMLRECYETSVVVTTVAGFAASRVGREKETLFELAMREFDIVVFDECDRVQKTLDNFFMPETSFNRYINESSKECSAYMQTTSKEREDNPISQHYHEMQFHATEVLSCILKSLRGDLGNWNKVTQGSSFSALTLLEDLHLTNNPYKITDNIYDMIYRLIDLSQEKAAKDNPLRDILDASCSKQHSDSFDRQYNEWIQAQDRRFEEESHRIIQDTRIKLILRLIYFDHFIRDLNDAYDAAHETCYEQNELFGFLRTRFKQQQEYLPSALCGNVFGLKQTDDYDIVLFRQFAFGRSMMKDLPYLRIDKNGMPIGPHTILLSGSSWAEGCYKYHVNRPVNYILEAEQEKRTYLSKTEFHELLLTERVSGAGEKQKEKMLKKVTEQAVEYIIRECQRNAGKILLVVNSYAQAKIIQKFLQVQLQQQQSQAIVCCLVSDSNAEEDRAHILRRGEVSKFADMSEEILVAPAMAIERGHNIVDEFGHSALGAVFFLVRPMSVPDDAQDNGSKLNGYIEASCKRNASENIFDYNLRVRKYAVKYWQQISSNNVCGIRYLSQEEQKDIVSTLFVLILQIFGRLARITDTSKPLPHVYFADGAFRRKSDDPKDFDCLESLGQYLDQLMEGKESGEIARTLYEPFYEAYRKGIRYDKKSNLSDGV